MIEFLDNNGTPLKGQWFEPDSCETYPVVLFATGDGKSGSQGETWKKLIPRFLKLNIGCFLFDFDGLGLSSGSRRELTVTKGINNLKAAIKEIEKNPKADKNRIAGVGSSFGGNVLLLIAPDEPRIKTIALKSPCCFIAEAFTCELGLEKVELWSKENYLEEVGFNYSAFLDSYNHNTYGAAKNLNRPVLVVHGSSDSVVPLRQSLDLVKFLPNGILKIVDGADHWYADGDQWEIMASAIINFVNDTL